MSEYQNPKSGGEVEARVRRTAARLGVADFVMIPLIVRKGAAQREIGDCVLCCGTDGAVLQVKSRDPASAASDAVDKAERWTRKQVERAISQAHGTRRTLRDAGPVRMRPIRAFDLPEGRRHELDFDVGSNAASWPLVIVLEHARLPSITLDLDDDVFVVTSADWDFLNHAIRSIAGLLTYIGRALDARPGYDVSLGHERVRFEAMCVADAATESGSPTWVPWMSHAALNDSGAADVYQHFIDRCWPGGDRLPNVDFKEYRAISEFLDRVPTTTRVRIGQTWRKYMNETRQGGQRSGSVILRDKAFTLLVDHTDVSWFPEAFAARVNAIAVVRFVEMADQLGPRPLLAIGVLTHPGATDYVFNLVLDEPNAVALETIELVRDDIGALFDGLKN